MSMEGLSCNVNLVELYLSHNGITAFKELETLVRWCNAN